MIAVFDDLAAGYRAPLKLDRLSRRQIRSRDTNLSPDDRLVVREIQLFVRNVRTRACVRRRVGRLLHRAGRSKKKKENY